MQTGPCESDVATMDDTLTELRQFVTAFCQILWLIKRAFLGIVSFRWSDFPFL